MKKNIFAVCDLEVDYAFNFMDYLNQKKNLPFEIQAFTTAESLIAYGKENHIELLLISDKAMRKEVRDLGIGKIIILSEGVHPPELDQYSSVYKYQSSSDVIREVMACYGEEKSLDPVTFPVLKKTNPVEPEIIKAKNGKSTDCASWQVSEDILCTCAGTDTGERTCRSLSESGILFWF